jgi:SulP family sulfate permease
MLACANIASLIPAAVLAGILITVGINVMDYKGLKAIPYMPKPEVFVMIVVLILSSIWNLVYAVGIGLVMASLMFMKKIGDLAASKSKVSTLLEEPTWADESNFPVKLKEEVFIKHLDGPLFFGSTSDFTVLSNQIPDTASIVIIRMDRVPYMDQTGLYAMEDILVGLEKNNITVLFIGIVQQPRYMMERIDIIPDLVSENHIFEDIDSCITWISANVEDKFDRRGEKVN